MFKGTADQVLEILNMFEGTADQVLEIENMVKGTADQISTDFNFREWHVRFRTVLFNLCLILEDREFRIFRLEIEFHET